MWAFMLSCKRHPSRAPSHDTRKNFFKTCLKNYILWSGAILQY